MFFFFFAQTNRKLFDPIRTTRFETFPDTLMVHMKRFVHFDWVAQKLRKFQQFIVLFQCFCFCFDVFKMVIQEMKSIVRYLLLFVFLSTISAISAISAINQTFS